MVNKTLKFVETFIVVLTICYIFYVIVSIVSVHVFLVPVQGLYGGNIEGNQYVAIGNEYYYLYNPLLNMYSIFNSEQISYVESYASRINTDYPLYIADNFSYNFSRRGSIINTMKPSDFLRNKGGICGDFAFAYAAYFLGKGDTVSFILIFVPTWSYGHIFLVVSSTAYDINDIVEYSQHLKNITGTIESFTIATVVAKYSENFEVLSIVASTVSARSSTVVPEIVYGPYTIMDGGKSKVVSMPSIVFLPSMFEKGHLVSDDNTVLFSSTSFLIIAKTKTVTIIPASESFMTLYYDYTTLSSTTIRL